MSLGGVVGNRTISELANEVIAQSGEDQTSEVGTATAIAERHAGKVEPAHLDAIKEALREATPLIDGLAS